MIVCTIRGKIIRTVLCCIVYRNCTQSLVRIVLTGELGPVGLYQFLVCVQFICRRVCFLCIIWLTIPVQSIAWKDLSLENDNDHRMQEFTQ